MPTADATLVQWWTALTPQRQLRKEIWTVVTLVAWTIWRHRNDIVFNGASPSADVVLRRIDKEGQDWRAASLLREHGSLPRRVVRLDISE